MIDWKDKAGALADQLATSGYLSDNQWRAAFQAIPRHRSEVATSSSTKPSLMARMLNVHTGHTVLEIGTGAGGHGRARRWIYATDATVVTALYIATFYLLLFGGFLD